MTGKGIEMRNGRWRALVLTDQCTAERVLPSTIGLFKTPTVRDLGQSQPYLHTGEMNTIEDVVTFYIGVSAQARQGSLRNGAAELNDMLIDNTSLAPLAGFLRALNEDYS